MAQGLIAYREDGSVAFNTSDRLGRVLSVENWGTSAIPAQTWTQVIDPAYAAGLWGVLIPLWSIDNADFYSYSSPRVLVDPAGQPGKVFVALPKDKPGMLVLGVY